MPFASSSTGTTTTWLDRPVPALGNRTPRAAARHAGCGGRRSIDLLKQLENAAERAALTGRPAYDFRWIWQELGLNGPAGDVER